VPGTNLLLLLDNRFHQIDTDDSILKKHSHVISIHIRSVYAISRIVKVHCCTRKVAYSALRNFRQYEKG